MTASVGRTPGTARQRDLFTDPAVPAGPSLPKEAAYRDNAAGPAATDEERRGLFAGDFVWHVPGDTDLSGDYSGDAYFTDMPARMQPLDELEFHIESLGANQDLVVSVARIRGRRLGRTLDTMGGHVLRFDSDARIIEAWGWCANQSDLDAFFA